MSGEPRLPAGWVPRGHSSSMFWVRSRHFTKQADLSPCADLTSCFMRKPWRDFPGGPVVRTKLFHCYGLGIGSLVRELRPHKLRDAAKEEKKKRCNE